MLDIKQIETFYPDFLRPFKKNMLREYLQYKILEVLFGSDYGNRLSFMGGSAIHVLHGNNRFSEDLDFDNLGLLPNDFNEIVSQIVKRLSLQGYNIESKVVIKKAFRAYFKFSEILYENRITKHKHEKLSIQIDTEAQNYQYSKDQFVLNKFDVFQRINAVPIDLLLSQKILCIFTRPRLMGRDFHDILFLLGKTTPDFSYLGEKLDIEDSVTLKKRLLEKCSQVDFNQLARDVIPFLYNAEDGRKISLFLDYIKNIEF
jgi:predicted nucleotidyltransferase component of viral defense system